jgi:hypothetical protein
MNQLRQKVSKLTEASNVELGRFFRPENYFLLKPLLILSMVLSASMLYAQSPTDLSGTWVFDISKSDPGEGGSFLYSDIIHVIKQTPKSISIEETIVRKGEDDVTSTETFSLDGKETTERLDYGITKRFAKWSKDKKTLVLTTIITVDKKDWRGDATYKLSDNGLTLTVQTLFKNPKGESTVVQVFNKK